MPIEVCEEGQGEIEHGKRFGDDDGFAFEPGEPVALSAIVALDLDGVLFAKGVFVIRQNSRVSMVIVSVILPDFIVV